MKTCRQNLLVPITAVVPTVSALQDEGWKIEGIYYSGLTGVPKIATIVPGNGKAVQNAQPIIAVLASQEYQDNGTEPKLPKLLQSA